MRNDRSASWIGPILWSTDGVKYILPSTSTITSTFEKMSTITFEIKQVQVQVPLLLTSKYKHKYKVVLRRTKIFSEFEVIINK